MPWLLFIRIFFSDFLSFIILPVTLRGYLISIAYCLYFIESIIARANQNPVMQNVCPNGLHPLVHLTRDVLCILLICFVYLNLNAPINNFTVMLGQGHRILAITSEYFWGENLSCSRTELDIVFQVRSNTRPLAPEADALTTCPAPHHTPLSSSISFISMTPLQLESEIWL